MLGIKQSIFRQMILSYILTIFIGLGIVGVLISYLVNGYIYSTKQEELLRKAKLINMSIQDTRILTKQTEAIIVFLDQSYDSRIWVFDKEGKIISTSSKDEVSIGKSVAVSIVERVLKGENVVSKLEFEGLSEPMLSVVVPWGKDEEVYGGIVLHAPVVGIEKTVLRIREIILWTSLLGLLLSTAVASYLSWSISRPLQRIDKAAAKIGMGHYNERIEIDSVDEIGDLAQTINTMAEKLAKIDQERKKLDQMRNDFLANVSHELRTPLTAMQGFLEALQDGLVDDISRDKYYDVMYKETIHMNRLVDDIFDLIKLENKEVSLKLQSVDVAALLHKIEFKFMHKAQSKNLQLNISVDKNRPKAYADPDRLEQIIGNLVKNAIKFTEKGQVNLSAKNDGDKILFTISDSGIGISSEDVEVVWERFFKVDRGRTRNNEGTGLGLAIVKELVQLHEGRIELSSKIGEGTTFYIWIPSVS